MAKVVRNKNRTAEPVHQAENSGRKGGYKPPPKEYQWKPGQSGNWKGRPKGCRNLANVIRELLDQKATDGKSGTIRDELARVAHKQAKRGSFSFYKEVLDRDSGKVPDKVIQSEGLPELDLKSLSDEELATLKELVAKAKRTK